MKALVLGSTGAIGLMRAYTPMPTGAVRLARHEGLSGSGMAII